MGQAENRITKKIKDYLTSRGIFHVKYFANTFTKAGIMDILACVRGKFVGIEVKTDVGRLSEIQKHQAEQLKKSGGLWYCVRPNNFDDFKQDIEKIMEE